MSNRAHHHRAKPSVDSVVDMLAGLDDNQAEALLRDLNHTAPSNVPVAEALDLFEGPDASRATRRRTIFLKAVSNLDLRSPLGMNPPFPTTTTGQHAGGDVGRTASDIEPVTPGRPRSAGSPDPAAQQYRGYRAYRRISRPWPAMASPSDMRDLLMAYLSGDSPSSTSSSATSLASGSPTTPRTVRMSPFCPMAGEPEDSPALDLLEPSPARTRGALPGFAPVLPPPHDNMSGIFEVLSGRS
ncbi:hypothetical protein DL764_003310 [Monosporascus ibericus]|uniref:Uncharacterized protein n=1 Tax=Monosporascus ibericus TaxID=155417 RepID=A0A4Q4THU7_9PEZI|nr:hypothetical protein DL764_003310 [Monosporascus ibericus]